MLFFGLALPGLRAEANRGALELASELLDGFFCRLGLAMLGPNDVLRIPKPSMNIPDVVRWRGPG